jgi:V8-like Glu-specific endopeptidase
MALPVAGFALVLGMSQGSLLAQDKTQDNTHTPRPGSSPISATRIQSEELSRGEYWTAERMANARPMPLPTADRSIVQAESTRALTPEPLHFGLGGRPTIKIESDVAPSTERFELNTGDELNDQAATPDSTPFSYELPYNNYRAGNRNTYPYSTMGKLFFTIPEGASDPAGDYVCSGSVALDNHTVVTARHCMYDISTHKWYSNWTFYPGWSNGTDGTLGGGWKVNFAYTWVSNGGNSTWYWDIGLLSMHDSTGKGCGGDSGKVIGNYTGWLGWTYGGDYTQRQWNIFGYPQAAPFEGNYLYQDNGATGILNPLGATGIVEVGNPQTGGTSGGPWIIGFDPNDGATPAPNNNVFNGLNLVNGVNSFQWTNPPEPLAINGPMFNSDNFENLYTAYTKAGCR